jgi:glycosyltransferase involved in cell wall biosynthesis
MRRERLEIVSVLTSREKGGAEYAAVGMLALLKERGHGVRLLTDLPAIADGRPVPVREIDIGPKLARATALRVTVGFVPCLVRLAGLLARERRQHGPTDVLLVHFKKEQLMAALLPRWLTGAVVWAEWGPLPAEFGRGPVRVIYRTAARRAAAVLAVSESTRRSLIAAGVPAAKTSVVPNAIDGEAIGFDADARQRLRASWGADTDTFVAGCVGRFHRKKRADVLIEACARLDDRVMLVLAGEGHDEGRLRDLAAPLGERVRFLPTPRGGIHEVLSAFDVALFAPAPTEGAPQAIVFAHLVGRPVIATDRPGAEELIPPGTGVIADPPQEPAAVAACIELYRRDRVRRLREGATARREAAHRHDRRRVEGKLEEVLAAAAAGGPS